MIPKNGLNSLESLDNTLLIKELDNIDLATYTPITTQIKEYETEADSRSQKKKHTINLAYGKNHRVDRVISIYEDKDGDTITKKDFYPKHFINGQWNNGLGDRTQWMLYHQELLSQSSHKWILWHEGEKAVDYALSRGLISTCIVGSLAQDDNYIKSKIEYLITQNINGLVVVADHDETGYKKAQKINNIALKCSLPSVILPIELMYPFSKKGDDIVEYLSASKTDYTDTLKLTIENRIISNKNQLLELINDDNKLINKVETVNKLDKTLNNSSSENSSNQLYSLIEQLVTKLSDSSISEADRLLEIGQFCSQWKTPSNVILNAIKAKLNQDNLKIELEDLKSNLDDLINVPNEQLSLNYIFGDYIAEVLKESALGIPTNPDAIVTILLPVLASVIGTRSRIVVNPNTRYIVPFILRTMIVAKSGNKKSPTARLAIDPLQDMNIDAYKSYKQELKQWQESGDDKQPKPVQRRFITQDSTFDGLIKVHEENPQGFLCFVDELYGYFKRMNKFYNGDDVTRDLELFEGKPLIKTRASEDSNIFLERTAISITGTIQEVALKQILDNKDDLTGISARWLIWAGKMPLGKLTQRSLNDSHSLSDLIDDIINELLGMDINSDLLIDDKAYELFRIWQNSIMDSITNLSLPQLENKYSKIESDVIKFAGILHFYYLVTNPELITNEIIINSEIMTRAIILGNHYLRHFCYIVTKCQENILNSQLLKILELAQKKSEITSVVVKQYIREFKDIPSTKIDELLLSLVEIGKVERIPTKRGVKIKIL